VRFAAAVAAAGLGVFSARAIAAETETAGPRFAKTSVEPSRSGDSRKDVRFEPDGVWKATSFTLRELIELAYQRHGFDRREVSGGPAWIDSERFDVTARAPKDHVFERDGFPRQTWLMLQALLADRFKLAVRTEAHELPVHALGRVDAGGPLGPRLRRSDVDCAETMKALARGDRPARPDCGFAPYAGRLVGTAVTIPSLASVLSGTLDRVVVDRTGLEGVFDVELEGVEFRPPGPSGPSNRPSDTKESVFTTLPKQLGLRLEARNGRVETIVVERAEKPTPE
jgi:uncharacterized protein (TIGR03435 family)